MPRTMLARLAASVPADRTRGWIPRNGAGRQETGCLVAARLGGVQRGQQCRWKGHVQRSPLQISTSSRNVAHATYGWGRTLVLLMRSYRYLNWRHLASGVPRVVFDPPCDALAGRLFRLSGKKILEAS